MNTQQLIENTMLHTLGLLEDSEIREYEAAFEAASESVQLLVREEAQRMGDFGDLMPNNKPDPALRELVISAVRAAMREQENDLRIASGVAPAIVGRIDPESARRAQPKISTTPKVHRLWRASTIGFAAATIALSVVWTSNNQVYNQSPDALIGQLYDNIGAEFLESTLFDPSTERVSMVSLNGSSKSVASVWHNPDWDSARLFVKNMKASKENPFRLVVLDGEGNIVREVATFSSEGELEDFEVKVNLKSDRRLAIYQGINDAIENAEPVVSSVDSNL
ncbi:MAG: hypothetical protein JKY43_08745 [Phycisphaerales bacterium]|nr:hypothetical protein [Phycisphaerales bacterium]